MPDYGFSSATLRTASLQHFVPLALSLGCALLACHASGVCFVDVKPTNIILTKAGCCLVDGGSIHKFGDQILPTAFSPRYCRTEFPTLASSAFDMTCLQYTLYEIFSQSWDVVLPSKAGFFQSDCFYEEFEMQCLLAALDSIDAFEFLGKLPGHLNRSVQHKDYVIGRFRIWLVQLGFDDIVSGIIASLLVGSEA